MKKKSEVLSHFQKLKSQVEKEKGQHIQCLRWDGGKEYQGEGIQTEFLCRHTPQQNVVAKRKNQHILEVACVILHEKDMPNFYCAEVTSTTVYLVNWCTANGVHVLTPYEIFVGTTPILSHLKVFGSIVYVHIPNEKRQKLDPKSKKCILVEYSSEQKGYKCFNPSTRAVQVS